MKFKGGFFAPHKLENHTSKLKRRKNRMSVEGKIGEAKNNMLVFLFFVLASLKIVFEVYLAVKFSKFMIRLPDRFSGVQTPKPA